MKWFLEDDPLEQNRRRTQDAALGLDWASNMLTNPLEYDMKNLDRMLGRNQAMGSGAGIPLGGTKPTVAPSAGTGTFYNGASVANAAGNGGGIWGKILGKLDPNMLLGIGASLLGGDDGENMRPNSFAGAGLADPRAHMENSINAIWRLMQGLEHSAPAKFSPSSVVQQGPGPVSIPGLPFQIGGGLGTDPALWNPSLMEQGNTFNMFQPSQSLGSAQFGGQQPAGASRPQGDAPQTGTAQPRGKRPVRLRQ